jgi:hypothetical protein
MERRKFTVEQKLAILKLTKSQAEELTSLGYELKILRPG